MLTVDYDRLGVGPGTKVIDVGAGAGRHSYEAYRRGADVIGGYAIRRNALEAGAQEFVDRLLGALAV